MSEPRRLPGLELFQARVSTPHLESGVQILTPDPWIALPISGLDPPLQKRRVLKELDMSEYQLPLSC